MQDGFEFFAGVGIRKDNLGEGGAIQFAGRTDDLAAESGLDVRERGLAGLDELARDFIGIHNLRAAFAEETGRRWICPCPRRRSDRRLSWGSGRSRPGDDAIEAVGISRHVRVGEREG